MQKLFFCFLIVSGLLLYSCEKPEDDLKPMITGLTPGKAPKGDFVAITGRNFSENPNEVLVKFNGAKIEFIQKATLDSIVVQIPYTATTGKVEVVIRGVTATSPKDFIVADSTNIQMDFPAPVITATTPGSASVGDQVIITGSNFLGAQQQQDGSEVGYAPRAIKINEVSAPILEYSDTRIVTSVPSGATTGRVTVTTAGSVFNMATPEQTSTSASNLIVEAGGIWSTKATLFPGGQRWDASGFSIGTKGYYGLGHGLSVSGKDLWEYDPATDQWTRKADFPGTGRWFGFAIGNKGYVGGSTDFWEYDPATNQWTRKADFPGSSRSYAVGFGIGNKGYIGTGSTGRDATTNNYLFTNDFWEYDPGTDQWMRKADFPGESRYKAVGLSIANKGYVGTGESILNTNQTTSYNDLWEYDPGTNQWSRKADLPGGSRGGAIAWPIGNYGYVGAGLKTGSNGPSISYVDYWQYRPTTNEWKRTADGTHDSSVGAFAIGNNGYYVEFKNEGYPPKVYQFTVR